MPSPAADPLSIWTEETGRDRRNTRWAIVAAVVIHALFFRMQLPDTVAAQPPPPERPLFVVQETRFRPPPPREQQQIPEQRTLRVPVPDPTPDDPEPLVTAEELPVPLDLVDGDVLFDLPQAPPAPPTGPLRVGGKVLPPVRIHAPPPGYPEIARRARIEGSVILEAVIDTSGEVTGLRVIQGRGFGLDEAALEAVGGWRFAPGTLNGKPVAVLYVLTVHFELD